MDYPIIIIVALVKLIVMGRHRKSSNDHPETMKKQAKENKENDEEVNTDSDCFLLYKKNTMVLITLASAVSS
jgi:hypothetical protein